MTEFPPKATISDSATLDNIHDAYLEDYEKKEMVELKF